MEQDEQFKEQEERKTQADLAHMLDFEVGTTADADGGATDFLASRRRSGGVYVP